MTSICLVTCVKNEGPFLLEWLAHYRNLGVTDFLIFSNHSDDGSEELLDHLDRLGLVRHLPNPSMVTGSHMHHRVALEYAPLHKEFLTADYALILDVDEFLQIESGDGTLQGLLHEMGDPDVISFSELIFGFGGVLDFEDRPITGQFFLSDDKRPGLRRSRRGVKSLMRVGPHVREYSNHRPQLVDGTEATIKWLNGAGLPVPEDFIVENERGFDIRHTYDKAWLNHYTLRSGESMLAKFDRGDAVRPKRMQEFYFRRRNMCRETNHSFRPHLPRLIIGMGQLMSDHRTAELHRDCVAAHRKRIDQLKSERADIWHAIVDEVGRLEVAA